MLIIPFLNPRREEQVSIPFLGEISRGRKDCCPFSISDSLLPTERAATSVVEIGRSDWTHRAGVIFLLVSLQKESVET